MTDMNRFLGGLLRHPGIRFALMAATALQFAGCENPYALDTTRKGVTIRIHGRVESPSGTPIPDALVRIWLRHVCAICPNTFTKDLRANSNGVFGTSYQYEDEFPASELCSGSRTTELGVSSRDPGFEDVKVFNALCNLPGGPLDPEIVLVLR